MPTTVEAGIRPHRNQFIREVAEGLTPADPDWELFSDAVNSMNARPDTNVAEKRAVGDVDPVAFHKGAEDHEFVINYDLQRWLTTATDPSYDGLVRDADNELQASHSIVVREERVTGGADDSGRRTYTVCLGAKPGRVRLTGEPESGLPVQVEITYTCESIRSYQIDQPTATGVVSIVSDSASDTTQSVTVEDEDAAASESIGPLTGITPVVGATSFPDIDAIYLDGETVGDITISIGAVDLCTIRGSASYETVEGDLGVPLLGAGSNATALGTVYEKFLGDVVQWDGADIADVVNTFEIEVDNGIEAFAQNDSFKKRIVAGPRTINVRGTVFGESASHDALDAHLAGTEGDITWVLTGGTITVANARLTEPGERAIEAEQTVMTLNNVFTGQGISTA